MTTQPEALRLADAMDNTLVYGLRGRQAADELRRQHEVIAELLLVAKLINSMWVEPGLYEKARAAIAKAEGVKP